MFIHLPLQEKSLNIYRTSFNYKRKPFKSRLYANLHRKKYLFIFPPSWKWIHPNIGCQDKLKHTMRYYIKHNCQRRLQPHLDAQNYTSILNKNSVATGNYVFSLCGQENWIQVGAHHNVSVIPSQLDLFPSTYRAHSTLQFHCSYLTN